MEGTQVSVAAFEKAAGDGGVKFASDLHAEVNKTISAFAGPDKEKGTAIAVVLGAQLIDQAPTK